MTLPRGNRALVCSEYNGLAGLWQLAWRALREASAARLACGRATFVRVSCHVATHARRRVGKSLGEA